MTNEKTLGSDSPDSIREIDLIFSQIRYILTRFGRVISLMDELS
jgi:hypothetical protein